MRQVGIGIVEEELAVGRLVLTMHARPVYGEGDAPHEQWLPKGVLPCYSCAAHCVPELRQATIRAPGGKSRESCSPVRTSIRLNEVLPIKTAWPSGDTATE